VSIKYVDLVDYITIAAEVTGLDSTPSCTWQSWISPNLRCMRRPRAQAPHDLVSKRAAAASIDLLVRRGKCPRQESNLDLPLRSTRGSEVEKARIC